MLDTAKSLPLTFYSRRFYADLVTPKKGLGFGFVLFIAFFGLISVSVAAYDFMRAARHQIETVLAAMPDTAMTDGRLSIDRPVPYTIAIGDPKKFVFNIVIDTGYQTGKMLPLLDHMARENISMLVTADKLFVLNRRTAHVDIHDFSKLPNGTITHDQWASGGNMAALWLYPACLLVAGLIILCMVYMSTLFLAVFIALISLPLGVTIFFQDAVRLASASGVPAGFIGALVTLPFPLKPALWVGYALFGIFAARKPRKG